MYNTAYKTVSKPLKNGLPKNYYWNQNTKLGLREFWSELSDYIPNWKELYEQLYRMKL